MVGVVWCWAIHTRYFFGAHKCFSSNFSRVGNYFSGNIVYGYFIFRVLIRGEGNEQNSQNWREEINEERDTCHCQGTNNVVSSRYHFSTHSQAEREREKEEFCVQREKKTKNRFFTTEKMVGPSRPQFVFFGSSIVQLCFSHGGWGSILSDIYSRKADILLRGYYGWNSRRAIQVLDQVFPKEAPVQPSLVIVYFGGNDSMGPHSSGLGPHVPLDEYIENMRKIAIHLKSLSDTTRIIFLSCPPVDETRVGSGLSGILSELIRTNELCQNYSNACIKLCQEMGVEVVDLFSAFQKRDEWTKACFTDGVHLSAEGSKIVVEEILKVLREAEWVPSLHWKSMPTEFSEDSPYYLVTADGKRTLNPSEWTFHREIQWD